MQNHISEASPRYFSSSSPDSGGAVAPNRSRNHVLTLGTPSHSWDSIHSLNGLRRWSWVRMVRTSSMTSLDGNLPWHPRSLSLICTAS